MTGGQTFTGTEGRPGLDMLLRKLLRTAIRQRGVSQNEIAKELTRRVGQGISPAMIANWAAASKEAWHLPAYVVPAICNFLGTDAIQRALLHPAQIENIELGESLQRVGLILEKELAQAKGLAKLRKADKANRPKR